MLSDLGLPYPVGQLHGEALKQLQVSPENAVISAIIVVERYPIGEKRFRLFVYETEQELGRELDVVTTTGYCQAARQEGFTFRGRLKSCVVGKANGRSRVIFSETEILEILDEIGEVNCRPHASQGPLFADPALALPPFQMGTPSYRIESSQDEGGEKLAIITVEVTFDPRQAAARATKVRERFLDVMQAKFPRLLDELRDSAIALQVRIVAPGTLRLNIKPAA